MRQTNRRHDLVAVHVEDPREQELPDVGILALEDAETGEVIELDTASAAVRKRFKERRPRNAAGALVIDFRSEGVDTLQLQHGYAVHARPAAILQDPRAQTGMNRRTRAARDAIAAARVSLAALAAGACRIAMAAGEASEDIRDIRGPKLILPWWFVAAVIGGVVLIALLGYPPLAAADGAGAPACCCLSRSALARLEEIRPLMQPARAREFSIAVSDIVRTLHRAAFRRHRHAADHRGVPARSARIAGSALLRHRALLAEFLHQCDLVKFAGLSLTAAEHGIAAPQRARFRARDLEARAGGGPRPGRPRLLVRGRHLAGPPSEGGA